MAYTKIVLGIHNFSSQSLSLNQNRYWQGYGDPSTKIREPEPLPPGTQPPIFVFRHNADSVGSIGALVYDIQKDFAPYPLPPKWIVAWSNEIGKPNKVYTEFLRSDAQIDWPKLKKILDGSSSSSGSVDLVEGYKADARIEPADGDTPTLTATLMHFS
ncbi:hypothetical protein V6N11_010253 [Hibiscus sabdariffa]|uniref:Uncharacterized protein n=1 Tax=Hibiscus sabdariffa TaxID=183260 RepID=A0ABR2PEF6_9ROSI